MDKEKYKELEINKGIVNRKKKDHTKTNTSDFKEEG